MNTNYTTVIYRSIVTLLIGTAIAWTLITAARAADATDWSKDSKSAMRLIAGTNKPNMPLTAGVEIALQPNWHTYWRYPGDSGISPRFDFSHSKNLKAAEVLYPLPHLHKDEAGQSLGYENNVIFPVKITPNETGQPVQLHVTLAYAVCEKICIPATGHAELELGIGESKHETILKAAEARVPKPVSATDVGLSVRRINGLKPLIAVGLQVPTDENVQLLAEGPTHDWALPIPKQDSGSTVGHQQFTFELDGLPPGTDPKAPLDLTFTIIGGDIGFEVKTHLD